MKIFVSYSSKDQDFVTKLVDKLPKNELWIDYLDLDLGDSILDKIEHAIESCSNFVLILSKNSLESRWVMYESEMAIIKSMKEDNLKIKTVKIDDCDPPLRFKSTLYLSIDKEKHLDKLIDKLVDNLTKEDTGKAYKLQLRKFVNRVSEINVLQKYIIDNQTKIIVLFGMYGIGKTSLLNETMSRVWKEPMIVRVPFKESFFGMRLCAELCARADIPFPMEGESKKEIERRTLLALEELISQNKIIIFDDFQNVIDEENNIPLDIINLFEHCISLDYFLGAPLFVTSTRKFEFNPEIVKSDFIKCLKSIKVSSMENEYIEMMLKAELINPTKYEKNSPDLKAKFIQSLGQHPLAVKFAAPLIEDYPLEFILENVKYIKTLRIDLARVVLNQIKINDCEEKILQLLGFCEGYLNLEEIMKTLNLDKEKVLDSVDKLVKYNIIEFEIDSSNIGLHPILLEIFSSKAATSGIVRNDSEDLTKKFLEIFKGKEKDTLGFLNWVSRLQRIYLINGKYAEARNVWFEYKGELKKSIRYLYDRKRAHALALDYCNKYLEEEPDDFSVSVYKIKCLIKTQKFNEALDLVENMEKTHPNNYILLHQKGRIYLKNRSIDKNRRLKVAKEYFFNSLSLRKDYFPVIRDLSEVFMLLGDLESAERYLNKALVGAPLDQYLLSSYGKVLGKLGRSQEAIDRLIKATGNIPDSWSFFHRLGWLYMNIGDCDSAIKYYKQAISLNEHFLEPRLGLLKCYLDKGEIENSGKEIDSLEKEVSGIEKLILENLKAEFLLLKGDIDGAKKISEKVLSKDRSEIALGSAIKIELAQAENYQKKGLKYKVGTIIGDVERYIDEIRKLNPNDPYIPNFEEKLNRLKSKNY